MTRGARITKLLRQRFVLRRTGRGKLKMRAYKRSFARVASFCSWQFRSLDVPQPSGQSRVLLGFRLTKAS